MMEDDEYWAWDSFYSDWSTFYSGSHDSAPHWKYDVFLSFRGEDTRTSFTDHLYQKLVWRGIKTFRDDPEIERGSTISAELSAAIKDSRFAVIVLSPNYASSTWCLDELEMINQSRGISRRLPVFYHVDPSDVRRQTGPFAQAFTKHEHDFKAYPKKVRWWREALTSVSNVAGWTTSKYRYETELIKEIVDVIGEKVYPTFTLSDSTENLFGIDFRLQYIDLLLYTSVTDVRFLGIWGMGGVGKTTIARLVYERISHKYEVSYFLANVRQQSAEHGIVHLQKQLISLVLEERVAQVCDAYGGAAMTKNLLCNKKVLLVLDDVDQLNQLEMLAGTKDWFGPGSRIIITTRDERLLIEHGIEKPYELQGLNDNQALQLFSWKAFKKYHPEEDYLELSKCFVDYAGGLPLALRTLGSSLYKRGRDAWISTLDKLKKAPNKTIFETLKISYDGLDDMEKRIFLNVACFHKGGYKERVIEILDSCGFPACIVIDILVEKSLLTIFDDYVMMHDLIQEMGRDIVRQESYEEPGQRSRLWLDKDIFHVFSKNTGTEAIEGIVLYLPEFEQACLNPETFSKMSRLKLLQIHNLNLSPGPKYLSNSLRFLEWSLYPSKSLPPTFQPDGLTELNLRHSKVDRLWNGKKHLGNLKYIDLSFSENLIKTPDFTGIPNLESVGQIECLKELDLSGTALSELPSSIVLMKNLEVLSFRGCKGPPPKSWHLFPPFGSFQRNSPEPAGLVMASLNNLHSVRKLDLSNCSFGEGAIPDDIGCLSSLEELNLGGNNFISLPASIRWLSQLILLNLEGCKKLQRLPDLPSNEELTITIDDCTSLEMLPDPPKLSRLRWFSFRCVNCYKLVGSEDSTNRPFSMLKRFLQGTPPFIVHSFNIVTPGSEIPEWFSNQTVGDSVVVQLPARPSDNKSVGFALCVVFEAEENPTAVELNYIRSHACGIKCLSKVEGSLSTSLLVKGLFHHKVGQVMSDHLWLLYASFKDYDPRNYWKGVFYEIEFSFKTFCSMENNKCLKLKKCGVRVVDKQDVVDLNKTMNQSNSSFYLDKAMYDLHCDLDKSASVQCAEVGQTIEHSDKAGPSGSGISDMESLSKRLKHE
ncbi:disease resistance protein Roq1-like isoform X2 [Rosa rugosa]|uniref:disease resistance protein Roq1-like isoform X2 n=1 Tax=Rosa rugosa TaxID=74645 RepID=UPI002B4103A0|nr:disease resistance protein Roq1-like isoform X2 [Rosa rugosa]